MSSSMESVFGEIRAERAYQDQKWGGPMHDRRHSAWDFALYAMKFLGKVVAALMNSDTTEAHRQFVKVAALCVAALENVPDLQAAAPECCDHAVPMQEECPACQAAPAPAGGQQ